VSGKARGGKVALVEGCGGGLDETRGGRRPPLGGPTWAGAGPAWKQIKAMRSTSTQALGEITYGTPEATSDNLAFFTHVMLIKSCDAPESNNIMMGHSLRKNVPASTSSPVGICWFTTGAGVHGEVACLS
jgi:hypothetical protein